MKKYTKLLSGILSLTMLSTVTFPARAFALSAPPLLFSELTHKLGTLILSQDLLPGQPSLTQISDRLTYWADQYNIPPAILKAVAWQESGWRQYNLTGQPLIGRDGVGIGIMQISDGDYALYHMTKQDYKNKLMTDYDFNISEGARILSQKWRAAPKMGDGDRNKLENWYLAVWAYNGWSSKNNPVYAKAHGLVPYQDNVMALVGKRYNSAITFTSPVTIPDPALFPQAPLDQTFAASTWAPSFLSTWTTPAPWHQGDLQIVPDNLLEGGGTTYEEANGDYWSGSTNGNLVLNALSFYVTGYEASTGAIQAEFAAKLQTAAQTVYNTGMSELYAPATNSDLYTAKRDFWAVAQLPGLNGSLPAQAQTALAQATARLTKRLSGPSREDTAVAIAKEGWSQGSDTVVLVNSSDSSWADSVTAVPLAIKNKAPILLTTADSLPPAVQTELQALRPQNIILVGGEGVLGSGLEQMLKATYHVTRYGGADRMSTAVQVAQALGLPIDKSAVLVGSDDEADAMAVASLAGTAGQPILYTGGDTLSTATMTFIQSEGVSALTVIGNETLIPDSILPLQTKNTRYGGTDRYATMLQMIHGYNPPIRNIFFAYGAGNSFADALAGGPLVAKLGGILLYADHHNLDPRIYAYLQQIHGYAMIDQPGGQIYEFGGTGVLSLDNVIDSAF